MPLKYFIKRHNLYSTPHDYPDEIEEKIEAINYLIEKTPLLIDVVKKIENKIKR